MPECVSPRLILVDTSAYFALLDRTDQHHRDAIQFLKANDTPLVTTDLIVVETLNLVRVRLGHRQAIRLGNRLLDPTLTKVLKVGDIDVVQAWQIFRRYRDKEFSFTDCTSFALMRRLQIPAAFAFDIHFHQYGLIRLLP